MSKSLGLLLRVYVLIALISLGGCTLIGAGIGGVAGSGTSVGVVGGAVIGAVIGHELGD